MNGIIRSSLKRSSFSKFVNLLVPNVMPEKSTPRMFSTLRNFYLNTSENVITKKSGSWNKCGCTISRYSTNNANDLQQFLEEEIVAEQNLQKSKTIPSKIDGFEVKLDGSNVTLTKTTPKEVIEINFNINHSVSNESEDLDETEEPVLKSKPDFEIDIKKGDTTLRFYCQFPEEMEDPAYVKDSSEYEGVEIDDFKLVEISLFKGEWKDTNYSVLGDILDQDLYDLLLNYLDEKGITNQLVSKISELSSVYEHSSYISLLRDLKKFAAS